MRIDHAKHPVLRSSRPGRSSEARSFDANSARPRCSRIGADTGACVRQGALYACAGLVDKAARECGGRRFLAGGDAAALKPHLEGQWTLVPDLVLKGLLAYAREQR